MSGGSTVPGAATQPRVAGAAVGGGHFPWAGGGELVIVAVGWLVFAKLA